MCFICNYLVSSYSVANNSAGQQTKEDVTGDAVFKDPDSDLGSGAGHSVYHTVVQNTKFH